MLFNLVKKVALALTSDLFDVRQNLTFWTFWEKPLCHNDKIFRDICSGKV
jgi:hypothetical protein